MSQRQASLPASNPLALHCERHFSAFLSSLSKQRPTLARTAAALHHGELAADAGYEWAEPYAETARRPYNELRTDVC